MKKLKTVRVTWLDAATPPDEGWKDIIEIAKLKETMVVTEGKLLKNGKTCIIIISSLTDDNDCEGVMIIPKTTILSMKELEVKENGTNKKKSKCE